MSSQGNVSYATTRFSSEYPLLLTPSVPPAGPRQSHNEPTAINRTSSTGERFPFEENACSPEHSVQITLWLACSVDSLARNSWRLRKCKRALSRNQDDKASTTSSSCQDATRHISPTTGSRLKRFLAALNLTHPQHIALAFVRPFCACQLFKYKNFEPGTPTQCVHQPQASRSRDQPVWRYYIDGPICQGIERTVERARSSTQCRRQLNCTLSMSTNKPLTPWAARVRDACNHFHEGLERANFRTGEMSMLYLKVYDVDSGVSPAENSPPLNQAFLFRPCRGRKP